MSESATPAPEAPAADAQTPQTPAPIPAPSAAPAAEAAAPEATPAPVETAAPQEADFTYEPSDALKPYFSRADDPAMSAARAAAVELGLTPDQFRGMIEKTFGGLAQAGGLPAPYDAAAELRSLAQVWGHEETPEGRAALTRDLTGLTSWAENFAISAQLEAGPAAELAALADTAAGAQALRALQKAVAAGAGPTPGGAPAAAVSLANLMSQMSDERYNPSSPKYDRAWRADLDARIQKHPDAARG